MRYAVRMTSRPTPFGTFAGCTVGHVGPENRLRLDGQNAYRRHSRLDMGYLLSLAEELNRDRELRSWLPHRPNSSLYRAAGRLRYAEARYDGPRVNYHLVAVEPDEFLDAALARARDGATPEEIAAAVAASDPDGEISLEEASAYVEELIDGQFLGLRSLARGHRSGSSAWFDRDAGACSGAQRAGDRRPPPPRARGTGGARSKRARQ